MEFKSILGLLPQYTYINKILYNDRYHNPTLNAGLYELDLQIIHCLKKIILVVQRQRIQEVIGWMDNLKNVMS